MTGTGRSRARRGAWFHCFAGIAGDMALGALLDAGADLGEVRALLERLPLAGWALDVHAVSRNGLAATKVDVVVDPDGSARTLADVLGLLHAATLPQRVHARAEAVFRVLAAAEGRVHAKAPEDVHFHELSGHDTIIDVVGTVAALEVLDIDEVSAGPVTTGTGLLEGAHGVLPNPSPAVLALLVGAPLVGRDLVAELVTPTGAAILAGLTTGFGPLPAMTVAATGYGAGDREFDGLANCTEVVLGDLLDSRGADAGQPLLVLQANLDDATGEQLADALAAALAAGALDAWVAPVVMKKGRPGHVLSALVDPALEDAVRQVVLAETGTLGVRSTAVRRVAQPREQVEVLVEGRRVAVKVSPGRVKAEHDDALRVAFELGLPVREVARRAEEAWRLNS